jgi:phage-related protein
MNKRNRNIFRVVFFLFLAIVIYVLYDMARQTTAPWNKKKQLERAIPK